MSQRPRARCATTSAAIAFAKEGADVAIAYLEEHDDASHTGSLVEQTGRRCLRLPGDLAEVEQCHAVVAQTAAALGGIDVLVIRPPKGP